MFACVSDAPKETEAVSVIGGADGPTSVWVMGKLGGGEEKDSGKPKEMSSASAVIIYPAGAGRRLNGKTGRWMSSIHSRTET